MLKFSNQVNLCQRGRVSLGLDNLLDQQNNYYEQICIDCYCGIVEMKMDFKVRGFGVQIQVSAKIIKKNWGGARSRDRVRGSIGLGIGIGLGLVVNVLLFLRNKKMWKNHLASYMYM